MSGKIQHILNRGLIVLGAVLIVTTGLALVAHGRQSADAQAQPAAGPATAADAVQITNFLYKAEAITVAVGTKVTFTNQDSAPHTATSGPSPNADGVFDTGTLKKGESKSVKLGEKGTFAYYCAIHPFMKGTVIAK